MTWGPRDPPVALRGGVPRRFDYSEPRIHHAGRIERQGDSMLGTILIVVLILMLLGALPAWPYSRAWGYYPTGGLGLVLLIIIILVLVGRV